MPGPMPAETGPSHLMRRRWFQALVAAVVIAYPAAGFYPYHWDPPKLASNSLEALPEGGLRFAGPDPGMARSDRPPQWMAGAMEANAFALDLSLRTASLDQRGPARIFTVSRDAGLRNLTLGQDRGDLVVRIRTPKHSLNGTPEYRVPEVFEPGRWLDIRVALEAGMLRIEIGGEARLEDGLPAAALRGWDRTYHLALGNELTGNRPWFGDIRRALVRAGDEAIDYAEPGRLEVPARIFYIQDQPILTLFEHLRLHDAVINLFGFVPLGLLLGLWVRGRGVGFALGGTAVAFAASLAIELTQFGIPFRHPSVSDLVLNTLGGALGILLAQWSGWTRLGPGARRAGSG